MFKEDHSPSRRLWSEELFGDLVVVGGGMAGVCCAITAARLGLRVILVQDRPVLGGNASSEVRLWVLGATCHMGSNSRWAREGGVLDEILLENMHRNPEGNPLLFDTVLLEKVILEQNITLLLNTAVYEVEKADNDANRISAVGGFCSQNSTFYRMTAPCFCDASGDGVLGFLSGGAFRMGAESREEFGEGFAPDEEFGQLLGHSLYFYSKDAGRPVSFVPPAFALKDIERAIPRYRDFHAGESGCRLWWIEYGGRLDTVRDTEKIKWELWRVVYGVWDYIKNSGKFPEAANLTLEWVGHIPGKRESRRFEGDYILRQQDVIEQRQHQDAVAFGGWALDLHPADGVYSAKPGCTHEYARGIYQIPYRCLYSRNIPNLFLGGRIMSASHVAFGSTRVMGTLAHCGQAIAHAANLCIENKLDPRDVSHGPMLKRLQRELLKSGQHIPQKRLSDPDDLVASGQLAASSEFSIQELPGDGPWLDLKESSWGQMLPVHPGCFPGATLRLNVQAACELRIELRGAHHPDGHTPSVLFADKTVLLNQTGEQDLFIDFGVSIEHACYVFLCLRGGVPVQIRSTEMRVTGLVSVSHPAPALRAGERNWRCQQERPELGIIGFELWSPSRRPGGQNLALRLTAPLTPFGVENLRNGIQRPTNQPNAWVADPADPRPTVTVSWSEARRITRVELFFDTDFDHPLESVLMGHPERDMPFCVRHYRVYNAGHQLLFECTDNHQTRNTIALKEASLTQSLTLEIVKMCGAAPAALFEIRAYA